MVSLTSLTRQLVSNNATATAIRAGVATALNNIQPTNGQPNRTYHQWLGFKEAIQNNPRDVSPLSQAHITALKTMQKMSAEGRLPRSITQIETMISGERMPASTTDAQPIAHPATAKTVGSLTPATKAEIDQLIGACKNSSWHQIPFAARMSIIEQAATRYLFEDSITGSVMAAQNIGAAKQDTWTEIREARDVERVEKPMVEEYIKMEQDGVIDLETERPQANFMVENFANMLSFRAFRHGLGSGSVVAIVGRGMAGAHHHFMANTFHKLLVEAGAPEDAMHILVADDQGKAYFLQESGFDAHLVGSTRAAKAIKQAMGTREDSGHFFGSAQGPNVLFLGPELNPEDTKTFANVAADCARLENAKQCTQLHDVHADPSIEAPLMDELQKAAEQFDTAPMKDTISALLDGSAPFAKVPSLHPADTSTTPGTDWYKPMKPLPEGGHTFGIRTAQADVPADSIAENWAHPALTVYSNDTPKQLIDGQQPIAVGIAGHPNWDNLVEQYEGVTVFSITDKRYSTDPNTGKLVPTYPVAARPGNNEPFCEAGFANKEPVKGNPSMDEFYRAQLKESWVANHEPIAVERQGPLTKNIIQHFKTHNLNAAGHAFERYTALFDNWAQEALATPISSNEHFQHPTERTSVAGIAKRPFILRITKETSLADAAIAVSVAESIGNRGLISFDPAQISREMRALLNELENNVTVTHITFKAESDDQLLNHLDDNGTPVICATPSDELRETMTQFRAPLIENGLSVTLPSRLPGYLGCYTRHIKTQATTPEGAEKFCQDAASLSSWATFNKFA